MTSAVRAIDSVRADAHPIAARNLAYRRLAAAILGVDVQSLAIDLRTQRGHQPTAGYAAKAARELRCRTGAVN